MDTRVHNQTYPSLTSNHTKFAKDCECDECSYEQVFKVIFDFTRTSESNIKIANFTILDHHNIDVSDRLNVRDYDRLMIELEDLIVAREYWDAQDDYESKYSGEPSY